MITRRRFPTLLLVAVFASAGCSDSLGPSGTSGTFQPELSNKTDSFEFQSTGVSGVTSTLTYSWANTGSRATINHSTTTSAGSATLVVRDAAGKVVYDKALVPSLNEPTASGAAGTWTIQLGLTRYTGTLNFRAQKL